ncbi:MAG: hypothetical protein Q4A27_03315 [bacterium]|nr:hypothetical protein [bacterium]
MKKRRRRRRFSPIRFIVFFVVTSGMLFGLNSLFGQKLPRSEELSSSAPITSISQPSSSSATESSSSAEDSVNLLLKQEIESRRRKAKETFENDKGKLFVDESYGGAESEEENEEPVGRLQIPALGFEREVYRGVGVSENGSAGFGDDKRLFKAVTWRADQTLGGDNFTIVSHVWNGSGFTDYSKDWFSPLLTSKDGEITTDLSKLKLQKGDEILITEAKTGYVFRFEIEEIATALHGNQDGSITDQVKELLGARIDHPRVTLQGCLMGTDQLFFVIGKLKSVQSGETIYSLN